MAEEGLKLLEGIEVGGLFFGENTGQIRKRDLLKLWEVK